MDALNISIRHVNVSQRITNDNHDDDDDDRDDYYLDYHIHSNRR